MGYFTNGWEGADWEEEWCCKCYHGEAMTSPEISGCCPVSAIHLLYNGEQHKVGNEMLKEAMAELITEDSRCLMFIASEKVAG